MHYAAVVFYLLGLTLLPNNVMFSLQVLVSAPYLLTIFSCLQPVMYSLTLLVRMQDILIDHHQNGYSH